MSNEELVEQICKGINTSDNMRQLYEQNRWFIFKIANKLTRFSDIDDLMQEAYIGLDTAVKKYDSSQGVLFLTYAAYWIKSTLKRYIDNNGRVIRIPPNELVRVSKYQKVVNDYIIEYGVRPSNDFLCYRLGINYKVLDKLKQTVYIYNSIKSLDEPYGEEEECYMYEIIPGRDCVENEAINNSMEHLPDIWNIIKDYIPHAEYEVIRMRFQDKLSLEAIGKQLGMSREAVRKLDASSMRHLRYRKVIGAISERYDVVEMKHRYSLEPHEAMAQKIQTSKQNAEIRRRNCLSTIHGQVQRREQQ